MVDFNTKKNILQKLRKKRGENKLLWLPCVIAAAFVKLWYGTVCRIGMALSDKNGNFLGIKMPERKPKSRRQDDIIYVKKPFIGRLMSAVLAAAFMLMVAPELDIDLGVKVSADVTLPDDITLDYMNTNLVSVAKINPGKPDMADWFYVKTEVDAVQNATVGDINNVAMAYNAAKITWTNISSADNRYFYKVGYELDGVGDYHDIEFTWNRAEYVFGETDKNQISNRNTYRFYVAPGKELTCFNIVEEVVKDSEGNIEYEDDGKTPKKHFVLKGSRTSTEYGKYSFTSDNLCPDKYINNLPPIKYEVVDDGTTVELTWENNATDTTDNPKSPMGYVIYRADWNASSSTYGQFREIEGSPYVVSATQSVITFSDRSVNPGNRYAYYIVAYTDLFNKGNVYTKDKFIPGIINSSAPVAGTYMAQVSIPPAAAKNVTVTSNKKDTLTISWDAPANSRVDGYLVYRTVNKTEKNMRDEMENLTEDITQNKYYNAVDGVWNFNQYIIDNADKRVAKTDKTSCLDPIGNDLKDQLSNDTQYNYFVIPYVIINSGGSELLGPVSSNSGSVGASLAKPQGFIAESGDGKVDLKWNAVEGADGYRVYITKTKNYDGSNEGIGETTTDDVAVPSYNHVGLYNKDEYSYYVKAYTNVASNNDEDPTKLFSAKSDTRKVVVGVPLNAPEDFIAVPGDGSISLSWKAVTGAEGYEVHYWKNGQQEKQIDRSTGNYNHINLKNGDVYNYYVVPYKTVNGVRVHGAQSETLSVTVGILLNIPQDLAATTIDGQINVTWSPVQGAEGYVLHYRNRNSNEGEKSIDLSRTTFNHTGLRNGDVYEYWVEAYKEVSGVRVLSDRSVTITQMVGAVLDAPKDFTAAAADGSVNLSWTAVQGAEGYIIHASSGGRYYQFDVSKVTYTHSDLNNGDVWTYYVTAYKTVNGSRTYSNPSEARTVTIGISLDSAVDLTATAGNRQIDLSWTAVNGADGYVVYLYNSSTMEFEPITVTSKTTYSHVGLKNGKQYTYMVAPYKNINGKRFYGDYSMSVTAIPTTGSVTDMDHELTVKGTAPYGISHSEYITAVSNHGAFDESVDVYFSTSRESTQEVRDVLKNYASGLSSFIIYPFDISIYRENTYIEVDPEDGYTVTVTMPVPDRLIAYRDYITVVHIGDDVEESEEISLAEDWYNNYDQRLEVLPCAIVDIDNVWCVQFKCSSFSPYALVIYKEHIQDVASGGGLLDNGFADTFNSGVLLFTALPDILPNNRKLKIVHSGSKRYHIKSITKR